MTKVGIRQLQQNASSVLRRVAAGESVEVTDRGRPVAMVVPVPKGGVVDRLEASGRLKRAMGDLLDLGEPIKGRAGVESPSRRLERMRAQER